MAKALKCDRCGGFFDYINLSRRYQIRDMNTVTAPSIDLCPDCYGKFLIFLDEEKFESRGDSE